MIYHRRPWSASGLAGIWFWFSSAQLFSFLSLPLSHPHALSGACPSFSFPVVAIWPDKLFVPREAICSLSFLRAAPFPLFLFLFRLHLPAARGTASSDVYSARRGYNSGCRPLPSRCAPPGNPCPRSSPAAGTRLAAAVGGSGRGAAAAAATRSSTSICCVPPLAHPHPFTRRRRPVADSPLPLVYFFSLLLPCFAPSTASRTPLQVSPVLLDPTHSLSLASHSLHSAQHTTHRYHHQHNTTPPHQQHDPCLAALDDTQTHML